MEKKYILRKCKKEDVTDILLLQDDVFYSLGDQSNLLRKNTKEMFEQCTMSPNITLGLYDGETLVGLGIFVDPGDGAESLALHLQKHNVEKGANFKLVMIKDGYRGQHFQLRIGRIFEKLAVNKGYSHLLATVSPDNSYSLNNLLCMGYEYDHSQEKYGGLIRNVMVKDLNASNDSAKNTFDYRKLPFIYDGEEYLLSVD